jgi:hypothetical protein
MGMNLEKYKNEGWGLSKLGFEKILEGIQNHETEFPNVVEFGSGTSTRFFMDIGNVEVYSFDNDPEYAFKPDRHYENLKLNIVNLVEFSEENFETMFRDKTYYPQYAIVKASPVHTRQRNTFYNINALKLPERIDYLLVDGPHGNGRSIAFLHAFKKFDRNTIIFIDDHTHYPFLEDLKRLIDVEVIFEHKSADSKWESGGNFIIVKPK